MPLVNFPMCVKVSYIDPWNKDQTSYLFSTEPMGEDEQYDARKRQLLVELFSKLGRTIISMEKIEMVATELPSFIIPKSGARVLQVLKNKTGT